MRSLASFAAAKNGLSLTTLTSFRKTDLKRSFANGSWIANFCAMNVDHFKKISGRRGYRFHGYLGKIVCRGIINGNNNSVGTNKTLLGDYTTYSLFPLCPNCES